MFFKKNLKRYKGFSLLGKIRADFGIIADFEQECKKLSRIFCAGEDQGRLLSYG